MPLMHHRRHPDFASRDALICAAMRKRNRNVEAIAEQFDLTIWSIYRIYQRYNPKARRIGSPTRNNQKFQILLRELFDLGFSYKDMAYLLHRHKKTIERTAHHLGLRKYGPDGHGRAGK